MGPSSVQEKKSRSKVFFFLRLVFSLSVVGFLIWNADISQFFSTLIGVNPVWLVIAFLIQIIGKFIWTTRWSVLLGIFEIKVPYSRLLAGLMVGLFFNNFLPTSMGGDFYRGYWILDDKNLYRKSLFVIFVERLIGFITLGFIAIPTIPFLLLYGTTLGSLRYWLIIGMIGFCLGMLLLHPRLFIFINNLFYNLRLNFFKNERTKILLSLRSLHEAGSQKYWVYLLSLMTQIVGVAFVFSIGKGLDLSLELWHYFIIVPVQVFVTLLPISINGLGVREWILILITSTLASNVTSPQAISLGLLLTLVGLIVSLIGGGIYVVGNRQATSTA